MRVRAAVAAGFPGRTLASLPIMALSASRAKTFPRAGLPTRQLRGDRRDKAHHPFFASMRADTRKFVNPSNQYYPCMQYVISSLRFLISPRKLFDVGTGPFYSG